MKNRILERFAALRPGEGEVAVSRLGQHSFLLKFGETLVAVDPYLADDPARKIPPLIRPEEFRGVKLVLCTHDHADHLDRKSLPAMAEASPDAVFCVPEAVRESVREIPRERLAGMNADGRRIFAGIEVSAVASAHEFLDETPEGLFPYLGYAVSANGMRVYHAGDCCRWEGLLPRLRSLAPDVMILPVNGRDAWRYTHDCIGCMTWQEAADLAGETAPSFAIPAHYDMFSGNTEDPRPFADFLKVKYPGVEPRILEPGNVILLKKGENEKNR